MLHEISAQLDQQAAAVGRLSASMARARFTPQVTVVVGPGGDRSATNYARFFSRPHGGGVGDSAADARAVANYLSIFRAAPSTLPGYGRDQRTIDFYRSLFTLIRYAPPPATGLRL